MAENGPEVDESVIAQADEIVALKKFHGAKYDTQISKIAEKTNLPITPDPELKEAAIEEGLSDDLNTLDIIHKAEMQKFTDPLTELPNRRGYELAVKKVFKYLENNPEATAYALFLDLDHFKKVNDSLGHDGGDAVLKAVADHLRENLRPGDAVARLGGEEFAVLVTDKREKVEGRQALPININVLANRLRVEMTSAVAESTEIKNQSVSIGVSEARDTTGQLIPAKELINRADIAAYQAKKGGRDRVILFQPGMAMPHSTPKAH